MKDDIDNYLETLFETARTDGASRMATSEQRVLAAIGSSSALAAASLAATKKSSWIKGSLFGAIVLGLAVVAFRREAAPNAGPSDVTAIVPSEAAHPASNEPSPVAVEAPSEIPSFAVDQLPSLRSTTKPNPVRTTPRPSEERVSTKTEEPTVDAVPAPSRPTSSIAEQIRLVDSARRHVAAHEGREALRALDEYASRFPAGALDEEATALRVEALDRSGHHAAAVDLGRRFLGAHPKSAYAARVALVLEKSPSHD